METEAPCYTWRRTSGAAPEAVKAARPVLNGGREETCRKVTRLAPTQLECGICGGGARGVCAKGVKGTRASNATETNDVLRNF